MKFWQRLTAALMLSLPLLAGAADNPQQVLQKATDSLLSRIVKDKDTLKKDPQALYSLVEENITPFMDVDGIARRVMGQYYKQATPAQQAEFKRVFKQSLIRTYAKGLTNYEGQKIVFKPYKPGSDPKKAQVDVDVFGSTGTVYPVTFQMQQDKAGAWKVQNLILNGINLGLTFRNQFSSSVEANRGSIDKAISGWTPDTQAIDATKGDKATKKAASQ
ncbi:MAG: transporter substrate-binding protein [Moraxellaceae bacterium]|jgi:phospholipid transport system substrate-binding protein|nr:transporter substrate-binding protein [Moraxellaceae bacterium]MDF3030415.1 transporter substrate-binding protein [Moraxellaceae bacterium]